MKTENVKRLRDLIEGIFEENTTVFTDIDYGGGPQKLTFIGSPHYPKVIDQLMTVIQIADLPEIQIASVLNFQDFNYKFVCVQDDGNVLLIQTKAGANTPQEILVHADGTTSKKSS